MATKIGEYKGQDMYYDAERKMFSATVGTFELTASIQEALQERITKALKAAGLFPIAVIYPNRGQTGRITSYDPSTRRGWFISEDGIRDKFYNGSEFYLDNPHNRMIMQAIQANRAKIATIDFEIKALKETLTEGLPEYLKAREAASEGPKTP